MRRAERLAGGCLAISLASAFAARGAIVQPYGLAAELRAVGDRLHSSVVEVRVPSRVYGRDLPTYGTGVLLQGGLVATMLHLVGTASASGVTATKSAEILMQGANGVAIGAQVIAALPEVDLALLRLESVPPGAVATGFEMPVVGETLLAMGTGDDAVTVMTVTVAALDGDVFTLGSNRMVDSRFWGGPLFDSSGHLVGICLPSISDAKAVSAEVLKGLLERVAKQ